MLRLLNVHGTLQATEAKRIFSTFPLPVRPLRPPPGTTSGVPRWHGTGLAPWRRWGSWHFFPRTALPRPFADGSSLPVAYSLLASSRLGYSPKMAYHRAYHTTFRKRGSNTNYCFRQKICGLTSRGPAASLDPSRSPVAAAHSPAGEAAANCRFGISASPLFSSSLKSQKD